MDEGAHARLFGGTCGPDDPRRSLFLLVQVVSVASQHKDRRVIGDAGFKTSFPAAGGLPKPLSHPKVKVVGMNAEHTIMDVSECPADLHLGERVLMQPFYSDATMCLHRKVVGVRRTADGEHWKVEREFDLSPSLGALQ